MGLNLFGKGKGKKSKKGGGSAPSAVGTRKVGLRTTIDGASDRYDKELVVVVWRYKSLVVPGHAALKIKRAEAGGIPARVDYISWWPNSSPKLGQDGMITARKGAGKETYWEDQIDEMTQATMIVVFVSQLYQAYADNEHPIPGFRRRLLKRVWDNAPSCHERWQKMGFAPEFTNMQAMLDTGKTGLRANLKVKKGSKYDDGNRRLDLGKLHDDFRFVDTTKETLDDVFLNAGNIGKRPDAKIYLPFAHLVELEQAPPLWGKAHWGPSFDDMRLSWQIFRRNPDPRWQMISTTINCSGAAYHRLVDGHLLALLDSKGKRTVGGFRRKKIAIQPNDITAIGEALQKSVKQLNETQALVEQRTVENWEAVSGLVRKFQLDKPEQWYLVLAENAWKKQISTTSSARSTKLREVDKKLRAYERVVAKMSTSVERKLARQLLELQVQYQPLWEEQQKRQNRVFVAKRMKSTRLAKFQGLLDQQLQKVAPVRRALEKGFSKLRDHREAKLKALVDLWRAIDAFLRGRPAKSRLPRVLLLAHCVDCAMIEATHHGHYINLFELDGANKQLRFLVAIDGPTLQTKVEIEDGVGELFAKK